MLRLLLIVCCNFLLTVNTIHVQDDTYKPRGSPTIRLFPSGRLKVNTVYPRIDATRDFSCASKSMCAELIIEPSQPLVGQNVTMECIYNIANRSLYTLKFCKDGREFVRYVPDEIPSHKFFPMPHLEIFEVTDNSIYFRSLNSRGSGSYSCEVTSGEPDFTIVIVQKRVEIVEPKKEETIAKIDTQSEPDMFVKLRMEPSNPSVGQLVEMECKFDIGEDRLYSIKFYKGRKEFYRYTPDENPSEKTFRVAHLKVTEKQRNVIKFQPLDLKASGVYSCEVTCAEPSFRTNSARKNLTVAQKETTTESRVTLKSPLVQLKITPSRPAVGQSVKLEWTYDIGDQELYAVKIYKDYEEFYRYNPKNNPPINIFKTEGVNVETTSLTNTSLVLSSVTSKTNGIYKCEVSADAPSFMTTQTEEIIEVQ